MYRILESEKSNIMGKEIQIGLVVIVFVLFVSNVLTLRKMDELKELTQAKTDQLEQNIAYFAQNNYVTKPEVVGMMNDHIWFQHRLSD